MKFSLVLAVAAALQSNAQPVSSSPSSSPTIRAQAGRIAGSLINDVEYYRGIPYAKPPVGALRLKPPVRLPPSCDDIDATGIGPACPQMTNLEMPALLGQVLATPGVADAVFLGNPQSDGTEDCLTLSVARPADTPLDAQLPVLYWIHGGGFGLGSSQGYNASNLIPRSVEQDKPFILVTVNYRLGGFGFLGGAEILAAGATNLGLRDQRMGLEWVADNIAAFGGDPDAVTIIGESAGAFSVFDHMALNDGDNTYKGQHLFRAAIMHSGSTNSLEPADGPLAQTVFDSVVEAAECSEEDDKVECLRNKDYDTFWTATMSVPSFLSESSIALSYTPRADGDILMASTDVLAKQGNFAKVPFIVGNMANEGTFFSVFPSGLATTEDLVAYLQEYIYKSASPEELTAFVETYNTPPTTADGTFPEFDRLAELLGDAFFTLKRREFLEDVAGSVDAWSYQGTWTDFPILGSFHTADLPHLFYGTGPSSRALQDRYIAFVNSLDPNDGISATPSGFQTYWPQWRDDRRVLNFGENSTSIITDDYRQDSFEFIKANADALVL